MRQVCSHIVMGLRAVAAGSRGFMRVNKRRPSAVKTKQYMSRVRGDARADCSARHLTAYAADTDLRVPVEAAVLTGSLRGTVS